MNAEGAEREMITVKAGIVESAEIAEKHAEDAKTLRLRSGTESAEIAELEVNLTVKVENAEKAEVAERIVVVESAEHLALIVNPMVKDLSVNLTMINQELTSVVRLILQDR